MQDNGAMDLAVTSAGVEVDTLTDGKRAMLITVYNSGSAAVFCKVNSTLAAVLAAAAAGSGAVVLRAGASQTWPVARAENLCLATASGSTTVDWNAVYAAPNFY